MTDLDISQLPLAPGVADADLLVKFDSTQVSGQRTQRFTIATLIALIAGRIPVGPAGAAAAFSSATATTLPPGSSATATLGGTGPFNYTLAFGIPKGDPGPPSGGTVTSVGLSLPSDFTVTNSPVTVAGTLTATRVPQAANVVMAGPTSGSAAAPTYRGLVSGDLPASPALIGTPTAPTAATADNSTTLATTGFVKAQSYTTSSQAAAAAPVQSVAGRQGAVTLAVADVSGAAPLASPALTGTPTAPTAAAGTNTTQIATMAALQAAVVGVGGAAPSAVITTTSGTTQVAAVADKGMTYLLSGSSILKLSSAVQVSGWYAWVKKTDGNGVWAITPVGVTIDGLSSINCYQESYLIWWDSANSVFRSQDRPKGWINIGSTTVSTAAAAVNFTTGFADTELRDIQFDFENVTFGAGADTLGVRVQKSGSYQTSSYSSYATTYSNGGGGSAGSTTSIYLNSSSQTWSGTLTLHSFASSSGSQRIDGSTIVPAYGSNFAAMQTTASAVTGIQFLDTGSSNYNITAGIFNQKAFRP